MAWTSPVTWASGLVTSTMLNQQIRDNFKVFSDPMTTYTPTWTVSSGTDPVLNNGSLTGRYMQADKFVIFSLHLTVGSTTTLGSGNYRFSLPVTARGTDALVVPAFQISPSRPMMGRGVTATQFNLYRSDTGVIMDNTSSGLTSGSEIVIASVAYEAA